MEPSSWLAALAAMLTAPAAALALAQMPIPPQLPAPAVPGDVLNSDALLPPMLSLVVAAAAGGHGRPGPARHPWSIRDARAGGGGGHRVAQPAPAGPRHRAVRGRARRAPAPIEQFRSLTGAGASARVNGTLAYVGSPELFERQLGVGFAAAHELSEFVVIASGLRMLRA